MIDYPFVEIKAGPKPWSECPFERDGSFCKSCGRGPKPKRKDPFQTAFDKGVDAYANGKDRSDCPYKDTRQASGKLTFARAFRNAWIDGFNAAAELDQSPEY